MGNVWNADFANDIIVVRQPDGTLRCSAVNVRFPHQDDFANWNERNVVVSINGIVLKFSLNELNPRNESNEGGFQFKSSHLKSMRLRDDLNDITFTMKLREQDVEVKARVFLWRWDSRIVITDVDGTITKSDKRGIFMRLFGRDWHQDGLCHLFSAFHNNGYKVIYLSGRPRYEAEATRNLLDDVQQDGEVLPKGPVIVSPNGWKAAFYREVWAKTQDKDFKIPTLKQILKLFSHEEASPFHAGFGNRSSDERTYRELKFPCDKIFQLSHYKVTINIYTITGVIQWMEKRGVVVKSEKKIIVAFFPDNYNGLFSCVDKFFPPVPHHSQPQTWVRRVNKIIKSFLRRPHHSQPQTRARAVKFFFKSFRRR